MPDSAVIGISGGVDSAVAALLLKKKGFEVTAVFLKMHGFSSVDESDAEKVSDVVGVPFVSLDVSEQFRRTVEDRFTNEYLAGRTPNPCVRCNAEVKTAVLEAYADTHAIEFIATGHYGVVGCDNGRYFMRHTSGKKDQSYMLSRLSQKTLSRLILPLGELNKEQIRKFAAENGIPVAAKHDSQDVCFIPEGDRAGYMLLRGIASVPGDFVLEDGTVVGHHKGICFYTVGQRKRLGIALGVPATVIDIDSASNRIVVSTSPHPPLAVLIKDCVCQRLSPETDSCVGYAMLRYNTVTVACTAVRKGCGWMVSFSETARFACPGQCCVIYGDAGETLLSGEITKVYYD